MVIGWLRTACSTRAATFSASSHGRLRQHDRELVAAEARAGVADAHLRVDAVRHLAQHRVAGQVAVLVVDALEVIDVDHQAGEGLVGALGARQLLAQARVQVAAVVEAGEEVGQPAAHQARAVHRVLDADGGDHAQVREEVARQLAREAERIQAREHQHPVELLVAAQRDERQAPGRVPPWHQQLVVGLAEGPEPGALQVRELRGDGHQRIHEVHPLQLLGDQPVAGEQVADLVLRVVQDQRTRRRAGTRCEAVISRSNSCVSELARSSSSSRSWVLRSSASLRPPTR